MSEDDKPELPRRGDEDWNESTAQPVFLIQRRRLVVTDHTAVEIREENDTENMTDEEIADHGWGRWEWDTWRVGFTRKACEDLAKAKSYDGPFRVYAVPAYGDLAVIVKALTDYEEH